jgi:hypothetical protein
VGITNFEKRKIRPVPSEEENRAVGAIASIGIDYILIFIPFLVRPILMGEPMNSYHKFSTLLRLKRWDRPEI